jgi:hypothetical protein
MRSGVSSDQYEERIEKGSSNSIVRPHPLKTVYFYNPSASTIRIRLIEIETDDIRYIFNASNLVQISGTLSSDALKAEELNRDANRNIGVNVNGIVETEIKNDAGSPLATDGIKKADLNIDATGDMQIDVKTLPALSAGENKIGSVDIATLPDIKKAGAVGVKQTLAAAGDVTIKAAAGKIHAIRAVGGNAILKDGVTEKWFTPAGAGDVLPVPISCGTSIVINLSAAGDVYVIYE